MGRINLSEKAIKYREEYYKKYNKKPRPWYFETETIKEYEEYLENELSD